MVMHSNDISMSKFAGTTCRSGKSARFVHRYPAPQTKMKPLLPCGISRPMEWTNLSVGSLGDMYDVFQYD